MKSAALVAVIFLTIFLASCRIRVVVPEGGSVVNAAGGFMCASGETCEVDVVDFFFDQTAVAKPEAGYRFKAWAKGDRRFCGGNTTPCRIYTVGLNDNESLAEIMTVFFESDEVFYLNPVFVKAADDYENYCGVYPHPSTSAYVLPFKVGEAYLLQQGNCGFSHAPNTALAFAYDFTMRIGTEIAAMRSGIVHRVIENFDTNSKQGDSNYVLIKHGDGSRAIYHHLAQNGVLVSIGDSIKQGQVIALSGHSGSINPSPHLHIAVYGPEGAANPLPFNFRNISPPGTAWLMTGQTYRALPY